tara:strand:+ start:16 stop:390 length:375 start_codon:yes stop_codon:yes gene_type:complete
MCNKLTILSFALLFSFAIIAQETSTEVNPEINFSNQSLNTENQIEIYPNPAADYIVIELTNSSLENIDFEMHSIIGNSISITFEDLGQDRYKIPVKDFASGYYFLVVKDEIARFKKAYKFLKSN